MSSTPAPPDLDPRIAAILDARVALVRRVQRATAEAVVAGGEELVASIADSTGLSLQGVMLAMTESLELESSDGELGSLVRHAFARQPAAAPTSSPIVVVLSANVFVGALRGIALARAASDHVVVRPSRRDPTLARAIVEAARRLGDTGLHLDEAIDLSTVTSGRIDVYGHDATIADIRRTAKVPVHGHGSGMGVAFVSPRADLTKAARGLADDVTIFDQRGCLSPRIALVEGDDARASAFAEGLHAELDRLAEEIPRGAIPGDERAAAGSYVATMTYACRALVGRAHAIGVAATGAPLLLPPPWRHVHVAPCPSVEAATRALAPLRAGIVAVGSDDPAAASAIAPVWVRLSGLGRMQRPPLDGPVDLRDPLR